jgi:hypothetical protein
MQAGSRFSQPQATNNFMRRDTMPPVGSSPF